MGGINHFGVIDYIAVIGTLGFSVCIGVYYAFVGKQTKDEMLVGGRNMKPLPIAASMLVTYFSAITILGYPAEIYAYGTQIYIMTILGMIFIPLSTLIYVKVFYEMKLTSVYEYLERRFDSIIVRWLTSFTFILQVLLVNGVILYAPAIALEAILGLPIWVSVVAIAVIGTVYTSVGGLKAVVWTDVFQFFMIMVGMFAIVTKGIIKAGGVKKAIETVSEHGRMHIFDFTVDPFMRHNTLNFFLGYGFTVMSLYGTHQPQVQRYCSLPTLRTAVKALLFTIPLKIFTMTIVLMTGISVTATYVECCPILLGKIKKPDQIIPRFVIEELAFIPGMMGIFVSCVFSAVLSFHPLVINSCWCGERMAEYCMNDDFGFWIPSSVSSTLNSLAAVTWEDFLSKIGVFKRMTAFGQANCTKVLAAIYGVLSIGLAFGAQNLGAIFQVVMTAVGATSGPLGGIFLCGLFIPFMNKFGAIMGILSGLVTMMFIGVNSFILGKKYVLNPRLPTYLTNCPEGTDFSHAINYTMPEKVDLDFPEKLYTLSYILYPFIGALITTIVGVIVSILTKGLQNKHRVERQYFHPWIRNLSCTNRYVKRGDIKKSAGGGPAQQWGATDPQPYRYELVPAKPIN